MLARPFRLRRRRDIARLYRHARRFHGKYLELKTSPNHQAASRATVVISSKVARRAVTRNRARRRLRGLLRHYWPGLKGGYDLLITLKNDLGQTTTKQLQEDLEACLKQAKLL